MGLLLPENPEFGALLKQSKVALRGYGSDADMSASHTVSPVSMTVVRYEGLFEMHHAVISQDENVSKIVMHFKKIALKTADALSRFLYEKLTKQMKVKATIQAGESPEFRAQWDLILFHVPAFEVKMLHAQIMSLVETFVGK